MGLEEPVTGLGALEDSTGSQGLTLVHVYHNIFRTQAVDATIGREEAGLKRLS